MGWVNRSLLAGAFARLRRSVLIEVTVLTAIVVVVGVLTDLRPGKLVSGAVEPVAAALAPGPPPLPPAAAVVDGRELGTLAVTVARQPRQATVTLLDSDGTAASGRSVQIDGKPTRRLRTRVLPGSRRGYRAVATSASPAGRSRSTCPRRRPTGAPCSRG